MLLQLERTEGDIEWRGPLPCPRPGHRGRGRGEVFQTLQWFSGKGRAFSNSSMVFGDGGKQNESMVFQCYPRLTPVAPVPFFLAFFKQKYTLMSWNLVFFQQYHYCKLHSRSCCKCRSCQVDEIVKIGSFNTLNEGVPFPVPAPVTGEGDGGKFSKHFNGFRGRGELFQTGDKRGHSPITIIIRGWKGDNPRLSPFSGAGKGTALSMVLSSLFLYRRLETANRLWISWKRRIGRTPHHM